MLASTREVGKIDADHWGAAVNVSLHRRACDTVEDMIYGLGRPNFFDGQEEYLGALRILTQRDIRAEMLKAGRKERR